VQNVNQAIKNTLVTIKGSTIISVSCKLISVILLDSQVTLTIDRILS